MLRPQLCKEWGPISVTREREVAPEIDWKWLSLMLFLQVSPLVGMRPPNTESVPFVLVSFFSLFRESLDLLGISVPCQILVKRSATVVRVGKSEERAEISANYGFRPWSTTVHQAFCREYHTLDVAKHENLRNLLSI